MKMGTRVKKDGRTGVVVKVNADVVHVALDNDPNKTLAWKIVEVEVVAIPSF